MSEIQMLHCFRNVARLFGVEFSWLAFSDGAKPAMPSANISGQHERGRAIRPTFEDVGTTCFLTNSVKVQTLNKLQNVVLISWIAETDAQPLRFRLTHFLIVAHYWKFAGQ